MKKNEAVIFSEKEIDGIRQRIDSAFGKYISVKDIKSTSIINKEAEITVTLSYTNDDEFFLYDSELSLRGALNKGEKLPGDIILIKDVPSDLRMDFRTYDKSLSFSLSYRQLRKLRGVINKILGSESDGK